MVLGILGAGGLGREMLETAETLNDWTKRWERIVFVVDRKPEEEAVQGHEVCMLDETARQYGGELELALAIGEPATRRKVIAEAENVGIPFVTLIHPSVTVSESTEIGNGSYIAPHCFISCNVKIGRYSIIQPNVNVGHDCVLGDNVSICGMTTLGGHCTLGDDVFLAMGVSVIQNCRIGSHAVVGLGSSVFGDLPDNVVALGSPARPVARSTGDYRVFR